MATLQANIDSWNGLFAQSSASGNPYYSAVLYIQMLHETGRGSSTLFREHNNLFGMRPAQVRQKFYQTTVLLGTGEYASYADPLYSLEDRINLDQYNGVQPPQSADDIPDYIEKVVMKGYATDPQYSVKWLNFVSSEFPNLGGQMAESGAMNSSNSGFSWKAKGIAGILLLIIGFILYRKFKK